MRRLTLKIKKMKTGIVFNYFRTIAIYNHLSGTEWGEIIEKLRYEKQMAQYERALWKKVVGVACEECDIVNYLQRCRKPQKPQKDKERDANFDYEGGKR